MVLNSLWQCFGGKFFVCVSGVMFRCVGVSFGLFRKCFSMKD